MTVLCFADSQGSYCEVRTADLTLPRAIQAQMALLDSVWFQAAGLAYQPDPGEPLDPTTTPLFFEWQRMEWLFEPASSADFSLPLQFMVNGNPEPRVAFRTVQGRHRLSGSFALENVVGKTRFSIVDARGNTVFELAAEVFPQKLDYKDDFPAMVSEITEIVYSLAFDVFARSFASTRTKVTYRQNLSEWLNLFRVLAEGLLQSLDTLLRSPKSQFLREHRVKPVERIKRASPSAIKAALKRPEKYCRGGGVELMPGVRLSHLREQHKRLSYDTAENRFVVWAVKDILRHLKAAMTTLQATKGLDAKRVAREVALLSGYQRKLRRRIQDSVFAEVGEFEHQHFFSTTLTMAAGYKEFYHRYLLMRKGLSIAESDLFAMDYKDIATLYEYWCFLKTVKLLRDNPKYDLTGTDVVKVEHGRFKVILKKGKRSAVHFTQRSSDDKISLFYNRSFGRDPYTHTFTQIPDLFIEFSRHGFGNAGDKKTFKVVLDAKYRFDRGASDYPDAKVPYGPPLDSIAQLHRYRDAILWQQGADETVRVANKSIGGVILFPYPNDENDFVGHPFYQSIDKVNIGAVPLQPGNHRQNQLFQAYLDRLFEQPGEAITEQRIHYDTRDYARKRDASRELVLVGMVPKRHREARLAYHFEKRCFYTQWARDPRFPLEKVRTIALYDQSSRSLIGHASVEGVDILLGSELASTGTTWEPRAANKKHIVYHLGAVQAIEPPLPAGNKMSGVRQGRFVVSRLGLDMALKHRESELLFINSWPKYLEWQTLTTQYEQIKIHRSVAVSASGEDISELTFSPF
jgi:hypothetical protein